MRRVERGVETTKTQHGSRVRSRWVATKASRLLVAALFLATLTAPIHTATPASAAVRAIAAPLGGAISASSTSLDFGAQMVETPSTMQTVTLTNDGAGDVTITASGIVGDGSGSFTEADHCTGAILSPSPSANATCTLDIGFRPAVTGAITASLVINDDDLTAGGSPLTVAPSGTGVSPADTPTVTPSETATDAPIDTPTATATTTRPTIPADTPPNTATPTETPLTQPTPTATNPATTIPSATVNDSSPSPTATVADPSATPLSLQPDGPEILTPTLTPASPTPVVNLSGCAIHLPLTVQAPSAAFTGAALAAVMHSAAQTTVRVTLRTALPQSVVLATAAGTTNCSGVFTARIHIASGVAAPAMLVVAASNNCRSAGATKRVTVQARCVASAARGGSPAVCMVAVGRRPLAAAVDVRLSRVFVVAGDRTVSVLDGRSGMLIRAVAAGVAPWQIAVNGAAGRAFVVDQGASRRGHGAVSVLDTSSGSVVRSVTVGTDPVAIAVDEQTQRVFVANLFDNTVSVLDARNGAVVRTVTVGGGPSDLAVDAHRGRIFVVDSLDSTVSVLDARTGMRRLTFRVRGNALQVAVDQHSGRVFVTSADGAVSTFDGRTGALLRRAGVGGGPAAIAVDSAAGHVFIAIPSKRQVRMLDTGGTPRRSVTVGRNPLDIAVDQRQGRAFVANTDDRTVSVLDTRSGVVVRTVAIGQAPSSTTVVAATQRLFVVSRDGNAVAVLDTAAFTARTRSTR